MGRDSRVEGCKSFNFDMKRITNIYLINTRYPSGGRGGGLDKAWFYLSCVGFPLGFPAKKSSTSRSYTFYAKVSRGMARELEQEARFSKAAYAGLRALLKNTQWEPGKCRWEPLKSFPSENIPLEKQFIIRYENLEQLALLFYLSKLRFKKSDLIELNNAWSKEYPFLKNKPGIYLLHNKITKKNYVGKAHNLLSRLENYCTIEYLKGHRASSSIYRAIIKFGYPNFSFSILEFCNEKDLSLREQYFINLIKPQYNIRKSVSKTRDLS